MLMAKTHYLPHEELKPSNYPELVRLSSDIATLQSYAISVDRALFAYNEGTADRIDVDIVELRKAIEGCRDIGAVLGNAPNVCYDILMEIREMMLVFQDLVFSKERFGSEYVGTPTVVDEEGGLV